MKVAAIGIVSALVLLTSTTGVDAAPADSTGAAPPDTADVVFVPSLQIPDTSLSARKRRINAYPYAYYTPETELAFGAGGIVTFYTAEDRILRPSSLTLSGYYATTKQYSITLNPKLYFASNRSFLSANLNFKHAVDKFYGIGNDSPDLGTEEYVADRFGVELDAQITTSFSVSDRLGLYYEYQSNDIVDPQENPYLAPGGVPGSDGGTLSGAGITWLWDSRDHTFYPRHGRWTRMRVVAYSRSIGSDFTYTFLEMDQRFYMQGFQQDVVAVQAYFSGVSGDAPFHRLPALGGSQRMRGYFEGRYRDNVFLTLQGEYRKEFSKKLGAVVFLGLGDVSAQLWSLRIDQFKYSYGTGLRYLFNGAEHVNLRADLGFGRDGSGVYFGVEEAF